MTETQIKTLETLAKVQYMTIKQMLNFGIYNAESTARKHLKSLVNMGILDVHNFGVQVGIGKLPSLYGLTPKGVRFVADNLHIPLEEIKASKSNKGEVRANRDFHHRVGLIDSLLAILKHLEQQGIIDQWSELYFRKYGMHAPKRTAITLEDGSRLEADSILHFTDQTDKKRFYLIEFYEDREQVERIRRALLKHGEAIATGKPSEALNLSVGHRTLLIFRHEHTARAIIRFLSSNELFTAIKDRFLITTHQAIQENAFKNWVTGSGQACNLY